MTYLRLPSHLAIFPLVVSCLFACNDPVETAFPVALEAVKSPPAVGAPGATLLDTIRVRVRDQNGKELPNTLVSWSVLQGNGSVFPLSSRADAGGIAAARWSLGDQAGPNRLEVRTENDTSLVFHTDGRAFLADRFDSNQYHACGLVSGDIWCWGIDGWVSTPPVSDGPPNSFSTVAPAPGLVSQGLGFSELAAGGQSVCALNAAAIVHCFLSSGGTTLPSVPALRTLAGAGGFTYCGLAVADSTGWCWWAADGSSQPVPSSPAMIDIEMSEDGGNRLTMCGRLPDSTAVCWGNGPLGDGTFSPSLSPVAVSGDHKFVELAVGWEFSCGRKADGEVWCWGRNPLFQLGGSGPDSPIPVRAASGISQIAIERETVLVLQGGQVARWGRFEDGQGHTITALSTASHLNVMDFSANGGACFRLFDHQVYCFLELMVPGSGFYLDSYYPVKPVVP